MDLPRPLIAALAVIALGAGAVAPGVAQTRAPEGSPPPSSDLELRFKDGVQELGDGAQKLAAALEAGAQDFWAAGKAAFEAGAQTWQSRRDARMHGTPPSLRRAPPY